MKTSAMEQLRSKETMVNLGYIIGLALIVTSVIYFFASNWSGLEKQVKLLLSIGIMAMFYGLAFLSSYALNIRPFVTNLLAFVGTLTFGVTLALIGQIYNSHADSYLLFLLWALPSLLFAVKTKYKPYILLSYALIHLAAWFYMFPSSSFQLGWDMYRYFFIAIALVNFLLFLLLKTKKRNNEPLLIMSMFVFHASMLIVTTGELFEPFPMLTSLLYIILLFLLWKAVKMEKFYSLMLGSALTIFLFIKFLFFLYHVGSEYVFLFTIFLPALIVVGVLFALKKMRTNANGQSVSKQVFVGVAIVISSLIGAISIGGIIGLFFGNMSFSTIGILAIAILILPSCLIQSIDGIIRKTMLFTGIFIAAPALLTSHAFYSLLLLGALLTVYWKESDKYIRYFSYLLMNVSMMAFFMEFSFSIELVTLFYMFIHLCIWLLSITLLKKQYNLYENSSFYFFLSFFVFTFLHDATPVLYFIVNALYFIVVTALVFIAQQRNNRYLLWLSGVFWFAYIVYKYYDLLWSLLHKSITFFIIGALVLTVVKWFDKRLEQTAAPKGFVQQAPVFTIIVLILQLAIATIQIGQNEYLLANGKEIELKLQPVDPRSMLQGDYVVLRYSISTVEMDAAPRYNQTIKVGLTKSDDGFYEYVTWIGMNEEPTEEADVWLNGRYKGNGNITYGIENYFVEEGAGMLLENTAQSATVIVSKSGNALLRSLQ